MVILEYKTRDGVSHRVEMPTCRRVSGRLIDMSSCDRLDDLTCLTFRQFNSWVGQYLPFGVSCARIVAKDGEWLLTIASRGAF